MGGGPSSQENATATKLLTPRSGEHTPLLGGGAGFWDTPKATSLWHRLGLAFLAVITLVTVHYAFYHLYEILVPFCVSGLIVFALMPTVECVYLFLAGLSSPYRWFGCFCRRNSRKEAREIAKYGSCCFDQGTRGPPLSREETTALGELSSDDREAQEDTQFAQEEESLPLCTRVGEGFARFFAVFVGIMILVLLCGIVIVLLAKGAIHMKEHWEFYKSGLLRAERVQGHVLDIIAAEFGLEEAVNENYKMAYDHLFEEVQKYIWVLVNQLITGFAEGAMKFFIVLLYVMFWLMQPLPTAGKVGQVVRSYLYKKSLVSALYGICVTLLFLYLNIDLAFFFGIISFFLNFVPEVGAFISMLLPIPVILFDGRQENPLWTLFVATSGQLVLKFFISNILEVMLIQEDREMNIHPVWIILGLSYFAYVWGPIGALLCVPLMAMVKTAALSVRGETMDSMSVVPALAETFLACFEGRHVCWAKPSSMIPFGSCHVKEGLATGAGEERPPVPLFMPPPSTPGPSSSPKTEPATSPVYSFGKV